ncbi:uracil-DNA glycosylase family protein [Brachymonas sp. M4Q-1]|uniref:uracil-DNA glycosylase family protein n=1 Tax=Brachymonas sp. M4Q-1 TaxID=3416906 RepID=UPI003CEF4AC2
MSRAYDSLASLLTRARDCRVCAMQLPCGARPVLQAGAGARLLIVGQAPGARVHGTGVPWSDASGERLRDWLALAPAQFYDENRVAILPMGFCYPGRGNGGDAPPRPECAPLWHGRLLSQMPHLGLVLLLGHYAQRRYLGQQARRESLAARVRAVDASRPGIMALPHPSPRNQAWFVRHPWFAAEVLPVLRRRVAALWPDPERAGG